MAKKLMYTYVIRSPTSIGVSMIGLYKGRTAFCSIVVASSYVIRIESTSRQRNKIEVEAPERGINEDQQ